MHQISEGRSNPALMPYCADMETQNNRLSIHQSIEGSIILKKKLIDGESET